MKNATQIPNSLFDKYLFWLRPSEVIILLVIFRQTIGWIDKRTGKRKMRDWITYGQFKDKTGLSRKTITGAIQGLVEKRLIQVTDFGKTLLDTPELRRGKKRIYYAPYFKTSAKWK